MNPTKNCTLPWFAISALPCGCTAFCEARFRGGDEKAEFMLLANLSAGFHEQIRLQPEITAALNASLDNPGEVKRALVAALLPHFLTGTARALAARRSRLDALVARLVAEANRLIRQVITDHLMTLSCPTPRCFASAGICRENFPRRWRRSETPG